MLPSRSSAPTPSTWASCSGRGRTACGSPTRPAASPPASPSPPWAPPSSAPPSRPGAFDAFPGCVLLFFARYPPMNRPGLSIFFPAYNDAGTIASLALVAHMTAREITDDYEVIVVDDGSPDHTGALLDEMA